MERLFGATSRCEQARIRGTLLKPFFGAKLNGGAEGLADDFNVRDPQKLYRLAQQRTLT